MSNPVRLSEIQTRHNTYKKRYPWRFNADAKDFLPRDREALLSEVRALTERIAKAKSRMDTSTYGDPEVPFRMRAALDGES